MKVIDCKISRVSLKNENTLFIDIEPDHIFESSDFIELKSAAKELGDGKRLYNIINVGDLTIPNKESRELSCSEEGSIYKKADAFVIHSLAQKIIANLMFKINKPVVPTKFFNSIRDAERWIDSLIKQKATI